LDDEGIVELMSVVDLFAGLNKLLDGLQIEMEISRGTGEVDHWNAVSIPRLSARRSVQAPEIDLERIRGPGSLDGVNGVADVIAAKDINTLKRCDTGARCYQHPAEVNRHARIVVGASRLAIAGQGTS
jgi:hypothetical protein